MKHAYTQRNTPARAGAIMFMALALFLSLAYPAYQASAAMHTVPTNDAATMAIVGSLCSKEIGTAACTPMTLGGLWDTFMDALSSAASALTSPDFWAYNLAQGVVTQITTELSNKIFGTLNSYVKDLREELLQIEKDIGSKLGIELNLVNACFNFDEFELFDSPTWELPKFKLSLECRVEEKDSMRKFYTRGGFDWDNYTRMAFNPTKYNAFGTDIALQKELNTRTAEAKENKKEQLSWGDGFRAVYDAVDETVRIAGATAKSLVDEAFLTQAVPMENADEVTEFIGETIQYFAGGLMKDALSGDVEAR